MVTKIFKFRIEFITGDNDWDEFSGVIDNQKRVVDLFQSVNGVYKWCGFIPFTAIKKIEIIEQVGVEEYDSSMW
jgi:hypothetical protein